MVDDHSRYKLISLLKHKSETITKANEFIANLKSMASSKADGPVKIVGNIKCATTRGRVPLA